MFCPFHAGIHVKITIVYSTSLTIVPPFPVSLPSVLAPLQRGRQDPITQRGRGNPRSIWTSTTVNRTPIVLRFEQKMAASSSLAERLLTPIQIHLWAEHTPSALGDIEQLCQELPGWVGAYDSWEKLKHPSLWKLLPRSLQRAGKEHPGVRLGASNDIFKHAVNAITEQRVTGIEAMGGLRRILRIYGTPLPRTGFSDQPLNMVFFPSPHTIAGIPSWTWHTAGYDRARSETIVRYASQAESIERLGRTHDVAELAQALYSISGVGLWTIAEILQRSHGHPDAVSVGDYHLAHHITWIFDGRRGNDYRMLEVLAPPSPGTVIA